jgi:hypothetical protein
MMESSGDRKRIASLEATVGELREALELAEQMLAAHVDKHHDYDYASEAVPPELASIRDIQHHLVGTLLDFSCCRLANRHSDSIRGRQAGEE